jgi:Ca-activated chloride channel family protein
MANHSSLRVFLLFLSAAASAQNVGLPGSASSTFSTSYRQVQPIDMNQNLWLLNTQDRTPLESPNDSVSKLDLKAPGKARREYEKGYQLLMRKDHQGALTHLTTATSIYPSFVAAHNALGSAFLSLGQTERARAEFAQAASLDDHLPASYFNLGCAEFALKHFPAAQEAIQKASTIAPLNLDLLTALAYGQIMNHDYVGAIATARRVHDRKHDGAAVVHFFAAAAWEAQDNIPQAQHELLTLLREDPKSPAALQAVQIMEDYKQDQKRPAASDAASEPRLKVSFIEVPSGPAPSGPVPLPERVRKLLQEAKENSQIAEAEADSECPTCATEESPAPAASDVTVHPSPRPKPAGAKYEGLTLHSSADEVAVFFAATDHGKSVSNLTLKDLDIHDDHKLPAAVIALRNESQLPLRLGLVIDTSSSVEGRFKFEQESATNFLQKVVTGRDDLAFVIGFANSVLLVQDFTGDQKLMSRSLAQLVPSGGTALWDAVAFAAEKLASHQEAGRVARVLVVISDGEDNSSSATLKQAITRAQRGEVAVYTVSTREVFGGPAFQTPEDALVGVHALRTLADLTGGTAFRPGSVRNLNGSLAELQQVIRSRYLVSYKPALFKRDGQYRAIDITAGKDGRKLRVYARKGYFASVKSPSADHF